jgi:hypothetical protein
VARVAPDAVQVAIEDHAARQQASRTRASPWRAPLAPAHVEMDA